jgi:hypothetical protein
VQSKVRAVISLAVVEAYNLALVARHRLVLHTVSEHNPVEVAVPIAVDMVAAGVVHMVVEAAGPIVAHTEMEVARMGAEVAHTVAAALDLAVGLDRMT